MSATDELPENPPPELRFRRGLAFGTSLDKLWASRHIIGNLAKRELRVRYNQAILGFGWAILAPVVTMVVISVFLRGSTAVKFSTHGWPYPIFLYTGLLAWTFFSSAVSSANGILVSNPLLNKVYAPREVFALATISTSAVDSAAATLVLGVLFLIYQVWPKPTSFWAIPLIVILLAFTTGIGLVFSALTVYLRDLRQLVPLLLQVGLFATPVIWPLSKIPAEWRNLYVTLNPVGGVIDGLRRCVLYGQPPDWTYTGLAAASAVVTLVFGYAIFKRLETGFADVS